MPVLESKKLLRKTDYEGSFEMAMKLHLDNPALRDTFEAVKETLPGAGQDWVLDTRQAAMDKFTMVGIPGPKVEEWKYTRLGFLTSEGFAPATQEDHAEEIKQYFDQAYRPDLAGHVLVFVNGIINQNLSFCPSDREIDVAIFSENTTGFRGTLVPVEDSSPLNNLNRALVTDGYHIDVPAGKTLTHPVQIIHIVTRGTDLQAVRTRAQVNVGAGAKAEIIESFLGAEGERYWSHMVSDIILDPKAELSLYQFQLQGRQAIHMTELHSSVAAEAKFNQMSLQLGAEVSRTELINSFTGENAVVDLRGAYLGRVKQSHDIFTRINHDMPHCNSNQLFRGVLDEGGTSAFQGKVVVAQDAQKTNADQSNKNLLLSRKAEANAKPELLIYADDVKCSHGATVGELDTDQLFYLKSRGLDEAAAKGLLVEAFISEVFDDLSDDKLKDSFKAKTAGWLNTQVVS